MIRIIIHTLSAHAHVCDRYGKPYTGLNTRSRDMSQLSLEEEDGHDLNASTNETRHQEQVHQNETEEVEVEGNDKLEAGI